MRESDSRMIIFWMFIMIVAIATAILLKVVLS